MTGSGLLAGRENASSREGNAASSGGHGRGKPYSFSLL